MIKERAIDAGTISVTVTLVVLAWWLAGHERDQVRASAARPGPTVTVSASPAPTAAHHTPRPASSPSPERAAGTVVAASEPTAGGVAEDRTGGRPVGESGSSASSTPRPSAGPRCVLGVSALTVHECLSIGGSR